MTKNAADRLFVKTNLKPQDVDVVELHDCFSANELITYEALGLCPPGKAGDLIDAGGNTYGGKFVVNPSGGLISKGHPLGATGQYEIFPIIFMQINFIIIVINYSSPQVLPSALNSAGNCEAWLISVKCQVPSWLCNTTLVWVVLSLSLSTDLASPTMPGR